MKNLTINGFCGSFGDTDAGLRKKEPPAFATEGGADAELDLNFGPIL